MSTTAFLIGLGVMFLSSIVAAVMFVHGAGLSEHLRLVYTLRFMPEEFSARFATAIPNGNSGWE